MTELQIVALRGIPAVQAGDDLGAMLVDAISRASFSLTDTDVLVVCQKVVSKAEGRIARLADVRPSERAREFAERFRKDPAVVELALREAREVLRMHGGHLITATGPGWVCANSGLDRSNQNAEGEVTLLPRDADRSAREIREAIGKRLGVRPAVIVSDTFGRPWRLGQVDVAIGAAGLIVLDEHHGRRDWCGRPLEHTAIAVADQLAAAAGLVMRKDAGTPAALIRGCAMFVDPAASAGAAALVRAPEDDLFR